MNSCKFTGKIVRKKFFRAGKVLKFVFLVDNTHKFKQIFTITVTALGEKADALNNETNIGERMAIDTYASREQSWKYNKKLGRSRIMKSNTFILESFEYLDEKGVCNVINDIEYSSIETDDYKDWNDVYE